MSQNPLAKLKNDGPVITADGFTGAPELREHDVVCEKGRGDHERWPGNKLYRSLINQYKDSYNDLTPVERSNIIGSISTTIRDKNGWFVQRDETTNKWFELTEEKVRKKVSDDLRREVRRKREKRSNSTMFSAKLKILKEMEATTDSERDILRPVNDPRQSDVLFGPGARRHPGNKTYWCLMKMNLEQYIISPYGARSMISRSIVHSIKGQNGRFLEQDPKTAIWYEISDKRAIEKTSHALSNKKYKTRRRNPDDIGQQLCKGSTGTCEDEDVSDDGSVSKASSSEPSLESDGSQSSLAKSMSKKFRLLNRMDGPEFDDDDKESIPHAANILVMGFPRANDTSLSKMPTTTTPSSPPARSKEERMIVTPNDTRSTVSDLSKDECGDHEPAGYRQGPLLRRLPVTIPETSPEKYQYRYRTYMEPRLGKFEGYVEVEYCPPNHMAHKYRPRHAIGLGAHGDYAPVRSRYHVEARGPPPPSSVDFGSPRIISQEDVRPPSSPYDERRVLQPRGSAPGGYWVRDWVSPSARRAEEYAAWR